MPRQMMAHFTASNFLDQTFTLEHARFGSSDRIGPSFCYYEFKFAPSSALDYLISLFTINYLVPLPHGLIYPQHAP